MMWGGKRVSVIFPTYNEKDSIRYTVKDFFSTGVVDEIVVVNNNAAPGTSEELVGTGAREIKETRQGYGYALLCGLDNCDADIIIFSEPDRTFVGADVFKLLVYSEDKPVVFGTRTVREFIWQGANMGIFLKWGNWAVAKIAELLFNTTILTDVGCTMRLFSYDAIRRLRPHLTIGGSHFGVQILMEVIAHRIPFVEVPVNYRKRIGISMATGNQWKTLSIGMRMILTILKYRLGFYRSNRELWTEMDSIHHRKAMQQPLEFSEGIEDTLFQSNKKLKSNQL
jgi:glycosyltransferase involved in cell wall biosynthesis